MKYPNGTDIRLGDEVQLSNGETATVMFSIDTNEYTDEFKKSEWEYLKKGIMVKTKDGSLIQYEDSSFEEVRPAI